MIKIEFQHTVQYKRILHSDEYTEGTELNLTFDELQFLMDVVKRKHPGHDNYHLRIESYRHDDDVDCETTYVLSIYVIETLVEENPTAISEIERFKNQIIKSSADAEICQESIAFAIRHVNDRLTKRIEARTKRQMQLIQEPEPWRKIPIQVEIDSLMKKIQQDQEVIRLFSERIR